MTEALAKKSPSTNVIIKKATEQVTHGLESLALLLSNPELPVPTVVRLYNLLNAEWKKAIEDQREAVREALLALHEAGALADPLKEGGVTYEVNVTQPRSKEPVMAALLAAAREKGLSAEAVADAQVTYVFNYEKALKHFSEAELDAMRKTLSRTLKVTTR